MLTTPNLSIGKRLSLLVAMMMASTILLVAVGFWGAMVNAQHVDEVFTESLVPFGQLTEIRELMRQNREILLVTTNDDLPHAKDNIQRIKSNAAKVSALWQAYRDTDLLPREKVLAERFMAEQAEWISQGLEPAMQALLQGNVARSTELARTQGPRLQKATETIKVLMDVQMEDAKAEFYSAQKAETLVDWVLGATLVVSLLFSGVFAWRILRSVVGPVNAIRDDMESLARNRDLTLRVQVVGKDECGSMAAAINSVLVTMEQAVNGIKSQSESLATASEELAASSRTILESTGAQSQAAASTASAIEQLAVSVSHVADSASGAAALAADAAGTSQKGESVVQSAASEINLISEDVHASSGLAQSLAQRSSDISGIVQVIKDVAEQTNLLALNAAIEAARAGEQGRGFAVVADEVRKLAERTARSAAEITTLITQVQSDTQAVVGTMDQSIQRVGTGVELAQQAADSLAEIRHGAVATQEKITEIADATKEQSAASNEIARHVERIAQMTEENSAAAVQAAELAGRLEEHAVNLRHEVGMFKTA